MVEQWKRARRLGWKLTELRFGCTVAEAYGRLGVEADRMEMWLYSGRGIWKARVEADRIEMWLYSGRGMDSLGGNLQY